MIIRKLFIVAGLSLTLQGCFFVGAAAGAAGIAVVYDHRKVESVVKDTHISNAIYQKIKATPELNGVHVNVTCFNQVVLLTGEAPTPALKQKVDDIAHSVPDISRVYNQVDIMGPTSSLTHASDSWITTKIKTQMLATQDLKSGTIKVVSENGTVYLMGVVTREQADVAVDIARQVTGVQKVIRIFQYKN